MHIIASDIYLLSKPLRESTLEVEISFSSNRHYSSNSFRYPGFLGACLLSLFSDAIFQNIYDELFLPGNLTENDHLFNSLILSKGLRQERKKSKHLYYRKINNHQKG